jgi:RNA polymerase sigma factor (sigma-70 family)
VIQPDTAHVILHWACVSGIMSARLRAAGFARSNVASSRRRVVRAGAPIRINASSGPKVTVDWAELIGRVAERGDREAFKALFEHFAPRIKGFLIKSGCNADEAEEIAQSTMVAVWTKAGQFDPSTAGAAAWIFTIARNQRIDVARKAIREGRLSKEIVLDDEADPTLAADQILSRVEDATRVEAAIERLSVEQSTVIRLSFIEERPHSEIAAVLGLPLGTVKSRIRLAMNRLRDLLDDAT